MSYRKSFPAALLCSLSSMVWAGGADIRIGDRPDPATGNEHYTGNRAPLLPSRFIALPPGAIEPRGWLHQQLRLQADGFHGHLKEISQYLRKENNAWLDPQGRGSHGWEELPYWLKGYGNLAYILGDQAMIAEAKSWIEGVMGSQQPDGWFGPDHSRAGAASRLEGRDDLWPNMIMLFCLQDYYGFTGDARVPVMLTRYFRYLHEQIPPDRLLNGYWPVMRGGDLLHGIYWLYNRTGDAWLLDLAKKVHADTARWDQDIIDWHNVNFAQGFREPATYYLQSQSPKDLDATYRLFRKMRQLYGQVPGGMFGADERARPGYTGPRQGTETCGLVEQMLSDEILLQISGDPFWADHGETVAFNTFAAALTPDLKALRYLTAPNQALSDAANKQPNVETAGTLFLMTAHQHRCCQHNWGHGWPYFAGLYAPSKVTGSVGNGQTVSIVEATHYPFDEAVALSVGTDRPVRFPLYLRIPGWCDRARITLNGQPLAAEAPAGKYAVIERTWSGGDQLTLTFPMDLRVKIWKENKGLASVERGPLTYSLQIGEKYVRHGGTDQWPDWEIHPATPWNYGLEFEAANPAGSFKVVRGDWPASDRPFTQAGVPIKLQARARKLPGWTLDKLGMVGQVQDSPIRSDEPSETVTLIPMGAARLRISAFPVIGSGPEARTWEGTR
ncbi:MAG: glycoside hydrolase family 127 protein [Kiritimatiellaeota bacterium]|nr:glycoside hydrolase family 127 protein [Kiritimatiellota bacterium]